MSVFVPASLPVRRIAFTTRCRSSTSLTRKWISASGSPEIVKYCWTSGTSRTIFSSSPVSVVPCRRTSVNASNEPDLARRRSRRSRG